MKPFDVEAGAENADQPAEVPAAHPSRQVLLQVSRLARFTSVDNTANAVMVVRFFWFAIAAQSFSLLQ